MRRPLKQQPTLLLLLALLLLQPLTGTALQDTKGSLNKLHCARNGGRLLVQKTTA